MTPFEKRLKQAMARREPADDFTQRVLQRAAQQAGSSMSDWFGALPRWFCSARVWRCAVATALLAVSGSFVYEQHEQAERGEAAKQKLLTAVRIAGVKLRKVHRQVLEVETPEMNQ